MTREEKIKILKSRKEEAEADGYVGFAEALGSAIEALEQEPCCNCIEFKKYAKEMGFEIEQDPKSEWQQDHEILKAYSDGANEVLGKIRAEIAKIASPSGYTNYDEGWNDSVRRTLRIIDKYKGESEE